jgi:hypothetical protein
MALVALALFVTLVVVAVTALTIAIAYVDCCEPFDVYPHPSPHRRRRTAPPSPATALPQQHHHLPPYLGFSPSLMLHR